MLTQSISVHVFDSYSINTDYGVVPVQSGDELKLLVCARQIPDAIITIENNGASYFMVLLLYTLPGFFPYLFTRKGCDNWLRPSRENVFGGKMGKSTGELTLRLRNRSESSC